MKTFNLTGVLVFTLALAAVSAHAQFARPAGFYAIGLHQQPPSVALVEQPFVDGVSLALGWSTVEPTRDNYIFTAIDQTLAVLEPFKKKLVLVVFPFPLPGYVNNEPGVQTYTVPHAGPGFLTPVPWDNFGLTRWEALFDQLANHLVPDGTQDGRLVPLRDHPLLAGLACWPMGMNGIRDIAQQSGTGTPIYTLSGYSRATLASAIIRSTHAVTDRFPGRFRYLPFFRIFDDVSSPTTLEVDLLAAFKAEFFSGAGLPQLGLFQENMSCTGPSPTGAFAMFQEKSNTYSLIQAIQSWVTLEPLNNAGATDPCLVTTVPGDRTTAVSGPEIGISRAFTNFDCRYFEIYQDDLLHPGFADEFQFWHDKLFSAAAAVAPAFTTQPASQTVTLGSSITFTAAASGSPAPTLQWQKDGLDLAGATNTSYSIASAAAGHAGSYTVTATNSAGSAASDAAILAVLVSRLADKTVTTGHAANFSAANASGSIQWQVSTDGGSTWGNLTDSGPYSGATTSTLTITDASPALNEFQYRFVASAHGSVSTSPAVTLTVAQAFLPFPTSIAADSSASLLVGDANANTIQKISPAGLISLVAGAGGTAGAADGAGAAARFNQPNGLALLIDGTIIVADTSNATIRRITSAGTVTTLAGSPGNRGNADGPGDTATFSSPTGIARDANGVLYVADAMNHTIRKLTPDGIVSTVAGAAGAAGFADGVGTAARFNFPTGLAVDGRGDIYVADTTNNLIRRITSAGVVSTLAGVPGVAGFDDGAGAGALFNRPGGLAADGSGNLYLADTDNSTIRKISPAGVVTTVAGLPTIAGLEDGPGAFALFNHPQALSVDASGNIFVADTGNAAIRRIDATGNVSTLALAVENPPTPGPAPTLTLAPAPTQAPMGGGGGGGAPTIWFFAALSFLGFGRRLFRHSADRNPPTPPGTVK